MSILPLTLNQNPLLHKKLAEMPGQITEAIRQLIADMRATMVAAQGIGLAANQVGKDVRIFTIDAALARKHDISDVFINPMVEQEGSKKSAMEEGCLSIPGKFAEVKRPAEVTVRALDAQGNTFRVEAKGLLARVLQHEIDHLNGILFIDRL